MYELYFTFLKSISLLFLALFTLATLKDLCIWMVFAEDFVDSHFYGIHSNLIVRYFYLSFVDEFDALPDSYYILIDKLDFLSKNVLVFLYLLLISVRMEMLLAKIYGDADNSEISLFTLW